MKLPGYRKHSSGKAFVEWEHRRHYLPGLHGEAESKRAYREFLRVHVLGGQPVKGVAPAPPAAGTQVSVAELVLHYLRHCENIYGGKNSEYNNMRSAVLPLCERFGDLAADSFGPRKLREYRDWLVTSAPRRKGCDCRSRSYVNSLMRRVRQMFKWGVGQEIVEPATLQALLAVEPLRRGQTTAPDHPKRKPVAWAHVEATIKELGPPVDDMVRVQWFTGVRSESLCLATPGQFREGEDLLLWYPRHKQEKAGQTLIVPIGPQAETILRPYLKRARETFLFDPRGRRSNRRYGRRYTPDSYRQAIVRAAERAGVPQWTPHQLRHARGTDVRKKYGLDAAQAALGHGSIDATQLYTSQLLELAIKVAKETG